MNLHLKSHAAPRMPRIAVSIREIEVQPLPLRRPRGDNQAEPPAIIRMRERWRVALLLRDPRERIRWLLR
ncbi:MAG: hypothetical protein E6417_07435, partial [Bradyrhizobium sp.]|nr:hypothetical protein [Bradyrhizobium sp.]